MTTCFGQRVTILRSIRPIIYNSSYRPEDGHMLTETCSHKDIL